jgi:hypothetical protein
MPIHLLVRNDHAFAPEDVTRLVAAFEETLGALELKTREDPATLLVAKVVFEAAKHGDLDPQRLREAAINAFVAG